MELKLDVELKVKEARSWEDFKKGDFWNDLSGIYKDWQEDAKRALEKLDNDREQDIIAKTRIQTLYQVIELVDILIETLKFNEEEDNEQ